MTALPGHSRRAVVAATAALAAAPAVEAKKKRKKKRKPAAQPPPLATALMTVSGVDNVGDAVACNMAGAWKHLASGEIAELAVSVFVPMETTGDAVLAFLVTALQGTVATELANNAFDVPPERIAITLI